MSDSKIRHIICAVRGGPESRETVSHAIDLALESSARLTFFRVMTPSSCNTQPLVHSALSITSWVKWPILPC